jgi:3,4-dihydroxy 2-butanone 4-phosphate synthase
MSLWRKSKMNVYDAIKELRKGNFILIHDSDGREDETDMVVAAEFITPVHVAQMRVDGGGLICLAVDGYISDKLGLPFTVDIYALAKSRFPVLRYLTPDDIPYDEKSSFSVSVNHRETFTGIPDLDRALTIRRFGELCSNLPEDAGLEFGRGFRSPGHVHLLISSGIELREGHTELSTALLEMAGLTPVAAICEMLDSETFKARSRTDAIKYAKKHNLVFLEGGDLKKEYENRHS